MLFIRFCFSKKFPVCSLRSLSYLQFERRQSFTQASRGDNSRELGFLVKVAVTKWMQEIEVWNKVVGSLMVLKEVPSHASHFDKWCCDVSIGSDEE